MGTSANGESRRILSLIPAATEILHFLDATDQLVGTSEDCDWPPEIDHLPTVTHTEIDPSDDSRAIDRQVKQSQHSGRSLYHVDEDQLNDLQPDLVLTQEQCEVCAPAFDDVSEACRRLQSDPEIISLEARDLDGVKQSIRIIAEAIGAEDTARRLIDHLQAKKNRLKEYISEADHQRRVVSLEWLEPPYVSGHWIPEMIEISGAESLGEAGAYSREIEWETVREYDPDTMVFMPCGYKTEDAFRMGKELLSKFSGDVFDGKNIFAVNSSYYFTRPGPRLWKGMMILAEILHPEHTKTGDVPSESYRELA